MSAAKVLDTLFLVLGAVVIFTLCQGWLLVSALLEPTK